MRVPAGVSMRNAACPSHVSAVAIAASLPQAGTALLHPISTMMRKPTVNAVVSGGISHLGHLLGTTQGLRRDAAASDGGARPRTREGVARWMTPSAGNGRSRSRASAPTRRANSTGARSRTRSSERPLEHSRWLGLQVRALLALVAVAEEGSFVAAARRLGYSRSTISHQIAQLESAVGVSLLVRGSGSRSVTVTPAGGIVVAHGRAVLRCSRTPRRRSPRSAAPDAARPSRASCAHRRRAAEHQ